MLNLQWGKSLSWSHDVFSSANVILSWIFPAAAQKWYCFAYLCVLHKKKKKKRAARLPRCFPLSYLSLPVCLEVQYLNLKSRVHRGDTAEAPADLHSGGFFLKRKSKIMLAQIEILAVQRSLPLSAAIQPAVLWLWNPDETPPTPPETTPGWVDTINTDFLQTTKMNYWALVLNKKWGQSVKHQAMNQARSGLAPVLQAFFFFCFLLFSHSVINHDLVKPYLVFRILALASNCWRGSTFPHYRSSFLWKVSRVGMCNFFFLVCLFQTQNAAAHKHHTLVKVGN